MFATAEDLAGNVNLGDDLELAYFIDAVGPQITDVFVTSAPDYSLFDPKPSVGPSPLVTQISIDVQDLPDRLAPDFLYPALVESIAEFPGHYQVVGDANGIIPIEDVQFVSDVVVDGQPATGTIIITFVNPLPDDRFTLTVSDALIDPACNHLDGESNADEPHEEADILFPTGDGVPGGEFVARFTIDTRPEVGVWAAGNVWVDTNGNFEFDPQNHDYTNRDIIYQMGYTSDDVFAGNFVESDEGTADGFDKLAVYGRVDGVWRWLVNTDNDGVPNVQTTEPLNINGMPVAGDFDGDAANGDEVGVFTGSTWYFDTNHDFQLNSASALTTAMKGYAVVGDFDNDGFDDLATYTDDVFSIDLANGVLRGWDGVADEVFHFGYIGVRARPVSADMDMDGFDDLGLWLPDRSGVLPRSAGEWQFLISNGASLLDRIEVDAINGEDMIPYTPVPFGPDMFAQFGDDYALPVVGNFDPPVAGGTGGSDPIGNLHTNLDQPLDVNADGVVSPIDALLIVNLLNRNGAGRLEGYAASQPYTDVNMDGYLSPLDALMVVNQLNASSAGEGEAEGEFSFSTNGASDLISATTPPRSELELSGLLVLSNEPLTTVVTDGVSSTPSSRASDPPASYVPVPAAAGGHQLLDSEAVRELIESIGGDELLETLPLDELLDELAVLINSDTADGADDVFRQIGDA